MCDTECVGIVTSMTEVERSGDCGNSPKNKLLEDLSVALYTSDAEFVLDRVTDDIQWNIVGEEVISFPPHSNFPRKVGP